ncbi:hypothetical protein Pmani_040273 [Petrolisthes manimaculis]|uniref:Uncharacterized protein n=1 Tax=Petrolisthes manimaculis TaxID=1843537 RepID=A0AAE1TIQ6_9EUCA|nr:hypothetical protein Pmani_040273 [Petrolisthes manimaculis]
MHVEGQDGVWKKKGMGKDWAWKDRTENDGAVGGWGMMGRGRMGCERMGRGQIMCFRMERSRMGGMDRHFDHRLEKFIIARVTL